MKTIFLILIAFISINLTSEFAVAMGRGKPAPEPTPSKPSVSYQEGDIIFIQSQTQQAAALREATGSVWTHVGIIVKSNSKWAVAEAVGPLKVTPFDEFVGRSKNKSYKIYRYRHFDKNTMTKALYDTLPKYNKPYDIYFEWSQDRIYCSELTYHVFKDVTGYGLGRVQKMKDMKLDGPYTQALIKKRYTDTGKELDPEEPIITPVSQTIDENVTLVYSSN